MRNTLCFLVGMTVASAALAQDYYQENGLFVGHTDPVNPYAGYAKASPAPAPAYRGAKVYDVATSVVGGGAKGLALRAGQVLTTSE